MTTTLTHDRYCAEIIHQTALLRGHLEGADLTVTVPTCPDWSLRELALHVGRAHRWATEIVRTRATESVPEEAVPGREGPADEAPEALDAWLAEGAERLAEVLREAGPDTPVWSWGWRQDVAFWSRRMAHETVVHRADAAIAAKADYDVAPDVAADTIEEWLDIVRFGQQIGFEQELTELRAGGRTLHLHATDTDAEWVIDLADDGLAWRHDHARADVALRGPLTELLLAFYRRTPVDDPALEIVGDRETLDFWLARATFG
jgi:uncharacterized protein (TIGR03083 family)